MPQQRGKSGKVKRGSRGGGGGAGGSGPPGKSQVIWGSIGNKQLDPLPGRSWTPHLEKNWTPSGTLKNDSFFSN